MTGKKVKGFFSLLCTINTTVPILTMTALPSASGSRERIPSIRCCS